MIFRELQILKALVIYAEENLPGGLSSEEQEVAQIVKRWAKDGVPVRPVCPHCGSVAPYGEEREPWLQAHVDNTQHRILWGIKRRLKIGV